MKKLKLMIKLRRQRDFFLETKSFLIKQKCLDRNQFILYIGELWVLLIKQPP